MTSSYPCTQTSEKSSTITQEVENPKNTNSCGVPCCFTCADDERHALLLTLFEEYLSVMQTHKEALIRGSAKIESRIKAIRAEQYLNSDLEPGHDELTELAQVLYDYGSALESAEDEVVYAQRARMYGDFDSDAEDGDDEEEEFEETVEVTECDEKVMEETLAPLEAEVADAAEPEAPNEEVVSKYLPSPPETTSELSGDQPLDLELLSQKLAVVSAKAEMEETEPQGSVGQYDFIDADPSSPEEGEEEEEEQDEIANPGDQFAVPEEEEKENEEEESLKKPLISIFGGLSGSRWASTEA